MQGVPDKMLYYNRISFIKGIDADKTGNDISIMYDICFFYFFKNKNFNYQPYVCKGCHGAS